MEISRHSFFCNKKKHSHQDTENFRPTNLPISILSSKFTSLGSPTLSFPRLSSSLTDRSQMDDHLSAPQTITSGVIHGSVLEPLLFLVHVNEICFFYSAPFLFTDDIMIIYTIDPPDLPCWYNLCMQLCQTFGY